MLAHATVQSSHMRYYIIFSIKSQKKKPDEFSSGFGDPSEIRTPDTLIKSQVLCQLS